MNNFIEWNTLNLKKDSGKEKVSCPVCDSEKNRKGDKPIQINHNEGFGKCFRCESLTFRDDVESESKKHYTLPQNNVNEYVNFSDKMLEYMSSRKISKSTLESLYVTQENYYQPAKNKNVDNVVFNYFEGSTLINKKYRSADKKFTQTSGAKSIFYNINSIVGQDECYIVEGEFDVLAMYEAGIKNVISVPNGANDNDDYWNNSKKYLIDIKKFIIATDNDEKGNDLKEKIAQRLGRYRCSFVEWKNKDANGDLIGDCIEESLNNVKRFPVSGTFKVSDLYDNILSLYDNGLPETISPKRRCFGELNDMFSVMKGHLITGTGIPSHGKSNWTDWYVLNLIKDYNFKASWFSPEHSPMELYHTNLAEKVIGKNFWGKVRNEQVPRITKDELAEYRDWADEKIYLTDCVNGEFPTWDWLFEKFKEQMYNFGIDIFVIDAFNKVLLPKGNKIDAINEVLTKLTSFAQTNNVIIFLVAHPTKMKKNEGNGLYDIPTLYDVSGSADFRNQTHDGFTVYRYWENEATGQINETEFVNMKTKFNFQGEIGSSLKFKYCEVNGRFYANDVEPYFNLINDEEAEEPKDLDHVRLPYVDVKDAFLDDDEIPF